MFVGIVLFAVAGTGGEHGVQRLGNLTDRGAGDQQHAEHRRTEQQWGGDPRRESVRERAAHREPDKTAGALAVGWIGG